MEDGEVIELGFEVTDVKVDDRVVAPLHDQLRPNAFSERRAVLSIELGASWPCGI